MNICVSESLSETTTRWVVAVYHPLFESSVLPILAQVGHPHHQEEAVVEVQDIQELVQDRDPPVDQGMSIAIVY